MASLNRIQLIGNLGRDPELKQTKSGTPLTKFSLATTEEFTSNGEKQKKTMWHNLVVWGKQAEIANKYLHKGSQVFVEGKIEYSEYEQDGVKKHFTNIKVDRFLMLGGKGSRQERGNEPQSYDDGFDDSDIPF